MDLRGHQGPEDQGVTDRTRRTLCSLRTRRPRRTTRTLGPRRTWRPSGATRSWITLGKAPEGPLGPGAPLETRVDRTGHDGPGWSHSEPEGRWTWQNHLAEKTGGPRWSTRPHRSRRTTRRYPRSWRATRARRPTWPRWSRPAIAERPLQRQHHVAVRFLQGQRLGNPEIRQPLDQLRHAVDLVGLGLRDEASRNVSPN